MKKNSLIFVVTMSMLFLGYSSFAQNLTSIFGEDWSKITYKVEVNPVFDISNVKTVIISEIVNKNNEIDPHCIDVYDELSNSISNIEGLTLADRSKTQALLKEFKFQQGSGLVDEDQIRKMGNFLGSGIIIFCRIQTDEFIQSIKSSKSMFGNGSGCKTEKKRVGNYDLDVNFKIIDLESAGIKFSRTLKSDISGSGPKYDCETPPELSSTDFYEDAREEIALKFKQLFTKHTKEHTIDFQTHSKFNDELKVAINYLEIDDFNTGYEMISKIPETMTKEKAKSAALYNLSMMQKFNGEYEVSLKNAKTAYMLNPKNNACLEIINELK